MSIFNLNFILKSKFYVPNVKIISLIMEGDNIDLLIFNIFEVLEGI